MAEETQRLLILGTGTFAAEIADLADDCPGLSVAGFVENLDRARCDRDHHGRPVYWVDELARLRDSHRVLCGLGTTHRSRFTDQADALGARFITLTHPTARVSRATTLGEGTILSVGTILAAHSRLGRHVCVNRGALIGHHTAIGDFVTIGPGANIAGNCHIGDATYIGMSAVVIDHVRIGRHCVIGAGAVVTKDLPDRVQVVGVPARIVKENIAGL